MPIRPTGIIGTTVIGTIGIEICTEAFAKDRNEMKRRALIAGRRG